MKNQPQITSFPDHLLKKQAKRIIWVSPHLDDAIFSSGSMLFELRKQLSVEVITIFTRGENPLTLSGKQFLKQSGYADMTKLYADRRAEDLKLFKRLDVKVRHAGFEDALCRKKLHPNMVERLLGRVLPEFMHVYPTYKFHIARGMIAQADQQTINDIREYLRPIIEEVPHTVVFCPIGTGQHIDHLVTRLACQQLDCPVIFWNDFPYSEYSPLDEQFIQDQQLEIYTYDKHMEEKLELMQAYRSQFSAVFSFNKGKVPAHTEMFFVPQGLFKRM